MSTPGSYREYIEQVRAAHNIKDVVGEYVKLDEGYRAPCPFHREASPSFYLNLPRQFFHCYGCKANGDIFKFIELREGVTFVQAVDFLAERARLPRYKPLDEDRDAAERERCIGYVTEAVARYYHGCLTPEARAYFTERRRLPEEFLERYMIGWADGTACAHIGLTLGPKWETYMVAAGLATEARNPMSWAGGAVYRDLFFDRMMFPMYSRGSVYLSGRTLEDREPKYLHQKGRDMPLYNEEAVDDQVYITEGPFDALSLLAWGYPAVALNGSPRAGTMARLQRAKRPLAVLDGDRAGFQETMVLATALYPKLQVVKLPAGVDPGDLYVQGRQAEFVFMDKQPMDPGRYAIEWVPKDTPREQLGPLLEPFFRFLQVVKPMAREAYLEGIKARFRLPKDWLERCREEIAEAAQGPRCPACGSMRTARRHA